MTESSDDPVKNGLSGMLPRLWRFAMVLSHNEDTAADLVQATCVRALQRSRQFQPGTHLDRWCFSIMASVWKNELRAQRIRRGGGFVDAEDVLVTDGAAKIESNILLSQVLAGVQALPEAQRSAVLLVYVEGLTYSEAAVTLDVPIGTIMSRLAAARSKLAALKLSGDEGNRRRVKAAE